MLRSEMTPFIYWALGSWSLSRVLTHLEGKLGSRSGTLLPVRQLWPSLSLPALLFWSRIPPPQSSHRRVSLTYPKSYTPHARLLDTLPPLMIPDKGCFPSLPLGFLVTKPVLISLLEQGEEPGALILQVAEERGIKAGPCAGQCKVQEAPGCCYWMCHVTPAYPRLPATLRPLGADVDLQAVEGIYVQLLSAQPSFLLNTLPLSRW